MQRGLKIGISFLRNIGVILIDSLLKLTLLATQPKSHIIGIVRLDDIGDFVTWLKCAEQIRNHYSENQIILIANKSWVKLAQVLPYWNEVISIDVQSFKWNFSYRWKIYRQIRALHLETIIQPTHICCLVMGDSVARLSGAKYKIGSEGEATSRKSGWQKRIANGWYTQLIPASPNPLMIINRNLEFTNYLTNSKREIEPYEMPILSVTNSPIINQNRYFLIFPGSNGKYKMWPKEKFASLASDLQLLTGYIPIICGSLNEIDLCNWIANHSKKAVSIAGKTSLPEIVEIIRSAEFVIGNDSGSIHIAATVNTVSFSILGGGHFGLFLPYPENWKSEKPNIINYKMPCYGCGWRCHFTSSTEKPFRCISDISVDFALESIQKELIRKGVISHQTNQIKKGLLLGVRPKS